MDLPDSSIMIQAGLTQQKKLTTQVNVQSQEESMTLNENFPSTETMAQDGNTVIDISDQEFLEAPKWTSARTKTKLGYRAATILMTR